MCSNQAIFPTHHVLQRVVIVYLHLLFKNKSCILVFMSHLSMVYSCLLVFHHYTSTIGVLLRSASQIFHLFNYLVIKTNASRKSDVGWVIDDRQKGGMTVSSKIIKIDFTKWLWFKKNCMYPAVPESLFIYRPLLPCAKQFSYLLTTELY